MDRPRPKLTITRSRATRTAVVEVKGAIDKHAVPWLYERVGKLLRRQAVILDLAETETVDSVGLAFFQNALSEAERQGQRFGVRNVPEAIAQAFRQIPHREVIPPKPKEEEGGFAAIGGAVAEVITGAVELTRLLANTTYWGLLAPFRRRSPRASAFVEQMVRLGSSAVPIIALLSLLIGVTISLQAAYQLRQFGANIYIANLVGVSMTRELGPLMTAIIVAGRSGAAIAAELGTMVVTEEVDALRVMGLNPVQYLVVPKFYAISITQMLLTVIADGVGMFGGFLVGIFMLELGVPAYVNQTIEAVMLVDVISGLVKSIAFGWIIVLIGAYQGFQVQGGADAVGLATTNSVVQGIFFVIVANAVFSTTLFFLR